MTRLIVVRHGHSGTNASHRYTGQLDVALTAQGHEQAACVARYLAENEQIDAIYSSDLSRAMDTARPTAAAFGLSVVPMRELRELHMGIFSGMPYSEVRRDYGELVKRRAEDPAVRCPEGESFADLFARIDRAIGEILAASRSKTVAVFTHAGGVRCIDCIASGGTYREAPSYPLIDNAAITIYRVENGQFVRELHGATEHLRGIAPHPTQPL